MYDVRVGEGLEYFERLGSILKIKWWVLMNTINE
jgi:hypothetical protein